MSISRLGSYWILGPLQDMAFVLLTPLPILLTFAAAQRGGWVDGLVAFALALAMAHYLPGIMRAYGDRALFRRFRVRLIGAPLFLTAATAWFAYLNLNFVFLLMGLWGAWHWMMQTYGFARIYDAKGPGSTRTEQTTTRISSWLDQTICLLWFGMCVFVLNNDLPIYFTRFYESGGPPLPAEGFAWFARAWLALTMTATLFYAIHIVRAIRHGRSPNPLKFVFIAVTFIYLKYTASMVDRPIVGYSMFESWHDIQYLAIVWMFNVNRARKNPEAGPFIRFLFRPRALLVLAYVALCLAFGSLTHAWRLFEGATTIRLVAAVVPAMALLHYYLDGFIWKIRETETRQALLGTGTQARGEPSAVLPGLFPSWARHALLWLLFVVPAALFFLMESKGSVVSPIVTYENLVQTFPDSPAAHFNLGVELQEAGQLRGARVHFERALLLAPGLNLARIRLGVLLADQRDLAGARAHFEQALRLDPGNAEVHNNLGIILDDQGDLQAARGHLELALGIDPQYALAHNNLGEVLVKQGKLSEAKTHFEQALRIQPGFASARQNLAAAEALMKTQ